MSEALLPDGTYDVFVVDADETADGSVTGVELTVLAGSHKGEVVHLGGHLDRSAVDLLGTPGTLLVVDGVPKLTLEG